MFLGINQVTPDILFISSLKNRIYLLPVNYSISANAAVSEAVVKFKTTHSSSCCTALDLSDCLTHTAGERKTFLRIKSVSGQIGLMKSLYKIRKETVQVQQGDKE